MLETREDVRTLAMEAARECIGSRGRLLSRVLTRRYDEALRPHGLRVTQFGLLVALAEVGPSSPNELIRRLEVDKSTLSRNIHRLTDDGLLHAGIDSHGYQWLALSEKGEAALAEALPTWKAVQQRVHEALGEEGEHALDALVERIKNI